MRLPRIRLGEAGGGRRIVLNTAAQVVADAAGKVAILVLYVAVGRVEGVAALGDLLVAASYATFLEIAGMGTEVILMRDAARGSGRVASLYWNSIAAKLAAAVVVCAPIAVVGLLSGYSSTLLLAIALMTASRLVDVLVKTPAAVLRGSENVVAVAVSLLAQRLVAAFGGLAALAAGLGVLGVCGAYLAGSLYAGIVVVRAERRHTATPPERMTRSAAWALTREALPLGVGTTLGAVVARADAIILSFVAGATAAGLYGSAYRLYEGSFFLSWAVGSAVFPAIARGGDAMRRAFEISLRVMVTGLLPLGGLMMLFPDVVARTIYGAEFADAAGATAWLGGAFVLYGVSTIATFALGARDRGGAILWISLVVAVVNVAANLVLAPAYGPTGAAAAMTISQVLLTVLSLAVASRVMGRIAVGRIVGVPLLAAAAMVGARLLTGDAGSGVLLAAAGYAVVSGVALRLLHPDDLRWVLGRLGRRTTPVAA